MLINGLLKQCLIAVPLMLVTACSDTSNVSSDDDSASTSARFSLALTDGPVDSARQVVVEFSGVSIKPVDADVIDFTFEEPISIDLLMLQGQVSQYILADESIPAGDYEWVRLWVNAEMDDTFDSFIEMDDGTQLELRVPSGSESGLKLVNGFTVSEESGVDFTIDFDLRKSIVMPGNATFALLKPTLRIVDTYSAGSVEGEIDAVIIVEQCENADVSSGAVYAFTGDVVPADVSGSESDPVVSALVNFDDGAYRYELGFLPKGTYTLAYTCDAAQDDPEAEDTLTFVSASNKAIRVKESKNTIVHFGIGGAPDTDGEQGNEKPDNEKPENEKPEDEKPENEKPENEKPEDEKPEAPKLPKEPKEPKAPKDPKEPKVETPEVPEVEVPEVEAPEVPEIEVPEVETPEVPEVEQPEVEKPGVDKPDTGKPDAPGKGKSGNRPVGGDTDAEEDPAADDGESETEA